MNKQELIEYCESLKGNLNKFINGINVDKIIAKIEQLDEPQKVTVPQFVADWYEKNKGSFDYNLWKYIISWEETEPSDFKNWINEECNVFQILVNMHQFGYTVEKEKRYLVKMKGMVKNDRYLKYDKNISHWYFSGPSEYDEYRLKHTRKELEEAGFGEVFNSPLFEVEEVKE